MSQYYNSLSKVKMEFGKYKNKTLGEIANKDRGYKYLKWIVEKYRKQEDDILKIEVFLNNPLLKIKYEDKIKNDTSYDEYAFI
jgi:uncharacterized protein (DUF3820 family)